MSVLVKFLGGVQFGSEALLPPGEYVLGGDDGADLAIADVAVRARHAILRVTGASWEVEPLDDAEVRLDGARISGKTAVAPYQVLTLGGTHLALGPDGPWDTLPVIPRILPDPAAPPEKEPAAAGAPDEPEPQRTAPAVPDAPPESNAGAARREAAPEPGAPARPKRRGRLWGFLALAAAIAAVLYYAYYRAPGDPAENLADQARERLADAGFAATRDAADALPAGSLRVEATDSGRVRLTGLMATDAKIREAIAAAGLPAAELDDRLRSAETEVKALAAELRSRGFDVRATTLANGFQVALAGVVDNAAESEAVNRLARERLDSRMGIRRRFWLWRELAREAEREARRVGIAGARLVRDNGVPRLVSDQPLTEDSALELAEAVNERLGPEAAEYLAPAFVPPPPPEPFEPEEPVRPAFPELPPAPVEEPPPPSPLPLSPPAMEEELPPLPPVPEEPEETTAPAEPETAAEAPVAVPPVPEPEQPVEVEVKPLTEFWRVADLYRDGFRDQAGRIWRVGESMKGGLRVAAIWRNGVVFQRGSETLFVPRGTTVFEKSED